MNVTCCDRLNKGAYWIHRHLKSCLEKRQLILKQIQYFLLTHLGDNTITFGDDGIA